MKKNTCKDCVYEKMCYLTHTKNCPACCDFKNNVSGKLDFILYIPLILGVLASVPIFILMWKAALSFHL